VNSPEPRISVIVAVYNSQNTIPKCLDSLCALDHPSYEVIVADDGSTDRTAELCNAFSGVRVIRLDRGGPSRARNVAVRAAQGTIIAFTDADCIVESQWLNELEKGFISSDVAGVGGDQRSPADESELGKRIQEFLKISGFVTSYVKADATFRETGHNASCNSAYRKSVFEEIGGFDEAQFPGEDLELDLKILRRGYRLIYNPAAIVGHYRPGTYREFSRMMRRYGAGEWHLVRKHGFFRMPDFEPVAAAVGLVVLVAMFLLHPGAWVLVLLPWPIIGFWFFLKTGNMARTVQFFLLFLIILANWNWGFFTGSRYRPVK
jgi:cellulose synthase/poly-beta-1,6-N-acetylglucosamine synthase-like glycosyltransferase